MRFDARVTSDLVDLPALRGVPRRARRARASTTSSGCADGSSRHRRVVQVDHGRTRRRSPSRCRPATVGIAGRSTPTAPPDAVAAATAVGRRWLGLDADPAPGVAALADDPVLGPLVRARPHLRVPGSTDAFETAVLVVLGQHVSLGAGRVFAARLVAAHGTDPAVGCPGGRRGSHLSTRLKGLRAFPDPEVLAALDPADLQRTVGITGARARTVVAMAGAVAHGALPLRSAPSSRSHEDFAGSGSDTALTRRSAPDVAKGDAETRERLLAIPGVGPWTADLVGAAGAARPRRLPPRRPGAPQGPGGVSPPRRPPRRRRPGVPTARSRCCTCGPTTPSTRRADPSRSGPLSTSRRTRVPSKPRRHRRR